MNDFVFQNTTKVYFEQPGTVTKSNRGQSPKPFISRQVREVREVIIIG